MKQPFKIAHISDLHLSPEHRRVNIRHAKRLLRYALDQGFDHLVITGDIAADAEARDMALARSLLHSHGLLHPEKLTLVIGNHDIFGGVHRAEDILTFPKRCRELDYQKKLDQFREYFREAFAKTVVSHPRRVFPFGKILGEVMLIGVNSIAPYSRIGNPIGSNGEVSAKEMERLKWLLRSPMFRSKRKLVLIHHHFLKRERSAQGTMHSLWEALERQTMKLRGKKALLELFGKENVELVMHGHLHESIEYVRKGVRFLNAGGSVLGRNSETLNVNFITITEGRIEIEIHTVDPSSALKPVAVSFLRPLQLQPPAAA